MVAGGRHRRGHDHLRRAASRGHEASRRSPRFPARRPGALAGHAGAQQADRGFRGRHDRLLLCVHRAPLRSAMKRHGEVRDFRPGALGRLLAMLARNKLIVASVAAMTVSFFAFIALLSVADLSFAVPATAGSYVFDTVLAKYLLKEPVTLGRWAGASLVACGVAFLSL